MHEMERRSECPVLDTRPPKIARLHPTRIAAPSGAAVINTSPAVLGLRGLNNLGQTCFMNCILQIFMHCPPVARFFLSDGHNRNRCARARQQRRGSTGLGLGDFSERQCLACEMDTLVSDFFCGMQAAYSPHAFLHAMWCNAESFAGYEQQDAHEFLIAMLAAVCAGLNALDRAMALEMKPLAGTPSLPSVPSPADASSSPLSAASATAAAGAASPVNGALRSLRRGLELSSIFSGVMRSEVTCSHCGSTSTKYEDFNDISLDISRMATNGEQTAPANSPAESLLSCLRSFTKEERLDSGERCWCSQCNSLQVSSKQLSIQRLPNVLCFHLKRFKQSSIGKQVSKIDTFVEFPLRSLNMYLHTSAFVCARASDAERKASPPFEGEGPSSLAPEHLYDLFGVAVHHGGMQNGHYTAFVRRGACWFRCDDASVNHAAASEVRSCKAYMLFYIRKALA